VEGVRLYHDQALFKEPRGGHTPWHQDQYYWPLDTTDTITMWMPLAEVTEEVGSMVFVTGSHLLGDLGAGHISDRSQAAIDRLIEERGLTTDTHGSLEAGDATFHAGWTLHSASPNPSGAMRPVMTVIYVADGARVLEIERDEQRLDLALYLPGAVPGAPAATDRNPLLWHAAS
jgi:ectoine hydroxylase-related dioxygenase (phytanoyl-CoA dioxygenase family)